MAEHPELLSSSAALRKVASGEYWVCIWCKELGKCLEKCLIKMKIGETSNAGKHLKEQHVKRIEKLDLEKPKKKGASPPNKSNFLVSILSCHGCTSFNREEPLLQVMLSPKSKENEKRVTVITRKR